MKDTADRDVVSYFASLPGDKRKALEALRQIIRETSPSSEEVISYQIPTFKYQGYLVAISAQKNHLSLHTMSKALMSAMVDDLKNLDKTVASLHFPYNEPPPKALIQKIIQRRMKENEERMKAKKKKS
jgi:uncharacterized protein YdhG (YjbR/CyaY superfamily)